MKSGEHVDSHGLLLNQPFAVMPTETGSLAVLRAHPLDKDSDGKNRMAYNFKVNIH